MQYNNFGGSLHLNFSDELYISYALKMPITKILIGNKFCSGIVLNNKYILTIKHAIEYQTFTVFLDEKLLPVEDIFIHKKEDLAIIKTNINSHVDSLVFYEDSPLIGKICSIGGYGVKYQSKKLTNDLIKRAGNNIIIWETDSHFECRMDVDGIDLEFLPTIGDSGGPVYVDNKLVGINKYVKSTDGLTDSSYGDISGHIKIRKYMSWINETINY